MREVFGNFVPVRDLELLYGVTTEFNQGWDLFLYVKREFMDQRIVPQGQLEEVVQVDDAFGEKVEFIVVQEEGLKGF